MKKDQNAQKNLKDQTKLTQNLKEIKYQHFIDLPEDQFKYLSNNVIKIVQKNQITYYVPVYCRLKLKNVVNLDIKCLTGTVNVDIIISIYYGGLLQQQKNILKQNIYLMFSKDPALKLKGDQFQITFRQKSSDQLYNFTIRKFLQTQLRSQITLAPFQKLFHILTVNFQRKVITNYQNKTKTTYIFNLMDYPTVKNNHVKISLGNQKSFGMYTYAQKMFKVVYNRQFSLEDQVINKPVTYKTQKDQYKKYIQNQQKQQKQQQNIYFQQHFYSYSLRNDYNPLASNDQPLKVKFKQINDIQYAHFIMPMYKSPLNVSLRIFFPLFILGIINMAISYQDNCEVSKQVKNIAALVIAFIALIPTIRQNLGNGSGISLIQVCVFLQALTSFFTLISIMSANNQGCYPQNIDTQIQQTMPFSSNSTNTSDETTETINQQPITSDDSQMPTVVIINIIATCINFILITIFIFIYQFHKKPKDYHSQKSHSNAKVIFDRTKWKNLQCDRLLQQKINFILKQKEKNNKINNSQNNYNAFIVEPKAKQKN